MSQPHSKALAVTPPVAGEIFEITIPPDYLAHRDQVIALSDDIKEVASAEDQQAAVNAVGLLEGVSKEIEKDRENLKAPFWNAGKVIDAKAKEVTAPVEARIKQLRQFITDFQNAEAKRIEAERQEALRKQREAEAELKKEQDRLAQIQRDAEEAKRKSDAALLEAQEATGRAKKKLEEEARRLKEEQDRIAAAATQAALDAQEAREDAATAAEAAETPQEAPKAEGASFRRVVTFEVTDIEKLYQWDLKRRMDAKARGRILTSFLKLEVKKRDFDTYANICDDTMLDEIPGVKFTVENRSSIRSVPSSLTLNQ